MIIQPSLWVIWLWLQVVAQEARYALLNTTTAFAQKSPTSLKHIFPFQELWVKFASALTWYQWLRLADMPVPRFRHAVVTVGRNMYLIGGRDINDNIITSVIDSRIFKIKLDRRLQCWCWCVDYSRYLGKCILRLNCCYYWKVGIYFPSQHQRHLRHRWIRCKLPSSSNCLDLQHLCTCSQLEKWRKCSSHHWKRRCVPRCSWPKALHLWRLQWW